MSAVPCAPLSLTPRGAAGGRRSRRAIVLASLGAALLAALLASICLGAYPISVTQLPLLLWPGTAPDPSFAQARAVLLDIRVPRALLALLTGVGFGAAGSALQALFRNPLADPGLIGVSSGAALGASTIIVLGAGALPVAAAAMLGIWLVPVAAFVGALAVTALVYRLAAAHGRLALPLLLLAGIAINAVAGALIGLLTYIASDAQLRSLTFWTLGSLGGAQWPMLAAIAPPVALGTAVLARQSAALNTLLLGEAEAAHLGVRVQALKRRVMVATALCIGALVACTGMIGFIGLVAPHCVRLLGGPDQRIVLPGAMLLGATVTLLADLAARTVAAPAELPLGILTALLGAPFFLMLLWRRRDQLGLST